LDKEGIVETEEGPKFRHDWTIYIRSLDVFLHDENGKLVYFCSVPTFSGLLEVSARILNELRESRREVYKEDERSVVFTINPPVYVEIAFEQIDEELKPVSPLIVRRIIGWVDLDNLEKIKKLQDLNYWDLAKYLRLNEAIKYMHKIYKFSKPEHSRLWLCPTCYSILSTFKYLASEETKEDVLRILKEKSNKL